MQLSEHVCEHHSRVARSCADDDDEAKSTNKTTGTQCNFMTILRDRDPRRGCRT
jgi:hypothetical protein